jgi:hypothetical protein
MRPTRPTGAVGYLVSRLTSRGIRLDSHARALAKLHESDPAPLARPSTIILTARELGCHVHPHHDELFDRRRLNAWSRTHLSDMRVLECIEPATFVLELACREERYNEEWPATLMASIGAYVSLTDKRVLQYMRSAAGEEWLYAVSTQKRRWSLDHRSLFAVRDIRTENEMRSVETAEEPGSAVPSDVITSPLVPKLIDDMTPGRLCGSMAIAHIMGAFGVDASLETCSTGGWSGKLVNYGLGKMMPWDLPPILRRHGIRSRMEWWNRSAFEGKLDAAIRRGALVIVLMYARRRLHGQHYVVVAGGEEYRGERYWYVTDGQFAKDEYALPRGNALFSTDDFVESLPRYGFGLHAFGTFVNVIECP